MNRLRKKNRAKEEVPPPRPSVDSESSGPFRMFGKNKKSQEEEEPKFDLDLASALPSNDDFRTSLLMTGLSARFSMLREQDDPSSKIGKASDDSVLFPKRQSRIDMSLAGLGDIAEVESIRATPYGRVESFQSDDISISGSVMNRAKPIEGNNLFGGRQKIYKIPASGSSSGLSGRALYDNDVAQSAFQRWRVSEKDKVSSDDEPEDDNREPESSQPDYHRRRETNSTSSGPSAARNSTAATSITSSQPGSAIQDQSVSTSTQNAAGGDRSFTRTRRLYEQGLNQEMFDQQSSALSRIDVISKQRTLGNRTPELTPTIPSPTSTTFSDRLADRRPILSKASAPNLRSFSPSTTRAPQLSPSESDGRFSGFESRNTYGSTPPLSPPISEPGEFNSLNIQPNDRGKATAMGVFNRPTAQYDESRFAQRQVQLQRGRETPTNRFRTESNASTSRERSRSSSAHRAPHDKHNSTSLRPEPTVHEEMAKEGTFLADADDEDGQSVISDPTQSSNVDVDAPLYPALRKSAVPNSHAFQAERPEIQKSGANISPEDSPTLGPAASGLSGMVRHHLRNESTDSSIYDDAPEEVNLAARFPPGPQSPEGLDRTSYAWPSTDRHWSASIDGQEMSPALSQFSADSRSIAPVPAIAEQQLPKSADDETDEFSRHLADGARRIRERLTTYVESESGRTTPTNSEQAREAQPPPRANGLGILKPKSGSESHSGLNARKFLGLGSSTMMTDSSSRRSSEEQEEPQNGEDGESSTPEGQTMHPGLKAFHQARRELQKMKENELQQKHAGSSGPFKSRDRAPSSRAGSRPGSRAQSRERGPPPVAYNRMPSEDMNNGLGSRSGSRAPSERDRSGSEASHGSGSRPPRSRNGSNPHDEHYNAMNSRQQPMLKSPGLPGTDIRRSPHMPPQPYPSSPGRLRVQPNGMESGQLSPISPVNGMPSPYGPPSPAPSRLPPQQPVPKVQLEKKSGSRSRSGSMIGATASTPNLHGGLGAPPLPPINPRRKNMMPGFLRRGDDESNREGPLAPLSAGAGGRESFIINDEEAGPAQFRQKLRKATSEANGLNSRAQSTRANPSQPLARPPIPRTMTGDTPGGMF